MEYLEKLSDLVNSLQASNPDIVVIKHDPFFSGENGLQFKSLSYDSLSDEESRVYDKHKRYLQIARIWSQNSYCERKKVGAIIVKGDSMISDGYNGTPNGFENTCELEDGQTKWYTLHAEANAITKLARSTNSSEDASLYISYSPCRDCSKLIIQSGIKRVVFYGFYRDISGFEILLKSDIELIFINENIL